MKHKAFTGARCPIARSLDLVGEWWSILILRDAFRGVRRFEAFQESLGIARNMLSRRLKQLVEAGLLELRPYSERPPRHEYRLTDKGRDFYPVLVTLMAWGDRWVAQADGARPLSRRSGRPLDPVVIDRTTGEPITPALVVMSPRAAPSSHPEDHA
jgi:DNA-binding HxlR family transcriptional regulator